MRTREIEIEAEAFFMLRWKSCEDIIRNIGNKMFLV